MPNTKSAKKALRSAEKKKVYNDVRKSKIKNSLKEFRRVLTTNPAEYQTALSKAFSSLDKAVKGKFIPKNRADRKKSRLAALAARTLSAEKPVVVEKAPAKPKKTTTKKVAEKAS